MLRSIESGRRFVGKVREGITKFTSVPPEEVVRARSVLSGQTEPTQQEISLYKRSMILICAMQGGGGNLIIREIAQVESVRLGNMTGEDWAREYKGYLTVIVERADKKLAEQNS